MTFTPPCSSTALTSSRASNSSSSTSTFRPRSSSGKLMSSAGAARVLESTRGGRTATSGSFSTNVEPAPRPLLCTSTVPPCSSIRCLTIASPRPETVRPARAAAFLLREAIEDLGQELRGDAVAVVDHRDFQGRIPALHRDSHAAATGRELHGVAEQVPKHLLDAAGVALDHTSDEARFGLERDAFCLRCRTHDVDCGVDHAVDVDEFEIQAQLSGDDAAHVEQVVDDLILGDRVARNGFRGVRRALRVEAAGAEQATPTQHGVQRRAQLVTHRGQEIVLDPGGFFRAISRFTQHLRLGSRALFVQLGDAACLLQASDGEPFLLALLAVGEVTVTFAKPTSDLSLSRIGGNHDVRPKREPSLANPPALVFEAPEQRRPLQL